MTESATDPGLATASVPEPIVPPTHSTQDLHPLTYWFFGPEGLRPGWGLLLYVSLFRLLVSVAQVLLRPAMHSLAHTLWHNLAQYVVMAACVGLPAVAMSRIEMRPFGAYGLPQRQAFGKTFAWGLLWGFATLSLLLLTLRGLHTFYFGSLAEQGTRAVKFALFWALLFLLVGFVEDFLFRGYSQFTLARGIGFWPAAVVLSTLFAWAHTGNPGETLLGILGVGLIGIFCCFTLQRTGSLWFAVGLHASWDWAQSYFYGVPDSGTVSVGHLLNSSSHGPAWLSGGSAGPEGSVLQVVLIALMFVVFHFAFPARDANVLLAGGNLRDAA